MAKIHVIIIPGGSCWASYADYLNDLKRSKFNADFSPKIGWQTSLHKHLGSSFKVLLLDMPNWRNAKYEEWKIWFEKALSASGKSSILVGHSLGAIFLAKYCSEARHPPNIRGLFLVSTPYKTRSENPDFGDFALNRAPKRLNRFQKNLYFYQSENDPTVSFDNLVQYQKFVPKAVPRIFKKRKHFEQGGFPELVRDIRSIK